MLHVFWMSTTKQHRQCEMTAPANLLCANQVHSELLNELVAIAETLKKGKGQLGHALYKLAVLHKRNGAAVKSSTFVSRALELRVKLRPQAKDAPFEEAEVMRLCLWMLW